MINTIIFDLDGTLIDSLVDLANTVNVILTEKGYPTHTLDEYRYFVKITLTVFRSEEHTSELQSRDDI